MVMQYAFLKECQALTMTERGKLLNEIEER